MFYFVLLFLRKLLIVLAWKEDHYLVHILRRFFKAALNYNRSQ